MEKNTNIQKLRLLYLAQILYEETDPEHGLLRKDIEEKLRSRGISIERKTLYNDLHALEEFGIHIDIKVKNRQSYYYVLERNFELAELKLLVDAVQASKFITSKKTEKLIRKLEQLASHHNAKELQRQVYVVGRVKTPNENILYVIDNIHTAINSDKQIIFQYYEWLPDGSRRLKYDGSDYYVSPWALIWDNQNYYLVGYNEIQKELRHYRVDKIKEVKITEDDRNGKELYDKLDIVKYTESMFGMFGGELQKVRIKVDNEFAGVFYDRFGTDIVLERTDDYLIVEVLVNVSDQFLGWILAIGNGVKIIAPEDTVKDVKKMLEERRKVYEILEK